MHGAGGESKVSGKAFDGILSNTGMVGTEMVCENTAAILRTVQYEVFRSIDDGQRIWAFGNDVVRT